MTSERNAGALRSEAAGGEPAGRGPGPGCRELSALAPGDRVRLCDHLDRAAMGRLADLGLVPGTVVTLVRRAPLGDPLEVELRGFRLCVRSADVAGICGHALGASARSVVT